MRPGPKAVCVSVQDYLPPAMHEAFLAITTEFVLLPWRHALRSALEGASQGGSQVTPSYHLRLSPSIWALAGCCPVFERLMCSGWVLTALCLGACCPLIGYKGQLLPHHHVACCRPTVS